MRQEMQKTLNGEIERGGKKLFLIRSLQNVLLENDFNRLLVALIRWCIKPEQNSLLLTMWGKWIGKLNGESRVKEQSLPRSRHHAPAPTNKSAQSTHTESHSHAL